MSCITSHFYRRTPTLLAALLLCSAASGVNAQTENVELGATEHFSGVFFSNFENAKFFVCGPSNTTCANWIQGEAYTLSCDDDVCGILGEKIRELKKAPDYTVYLRVELTGQRSLKKTTPRFLGEPGQFIRVEKIESITVQPE